MCAKPQHVNDIDSSHCCACPSFLRGVAQLIITHKMFHDSFEDPLCDASRPSTAIQRSALLIEREPFIVCVTVGRSGARALRLGIIWGHLICVCPAVSNLVTASWFYRSLTRVTKSLARSAKKQQGTLLGKRSSAPVIDRWLLHVNVWRNVLDFDTRAHTYVRASHT